MSFKYPKLEDGFAFASFSDLHLGVRRNDTRKMVQALRKAIFDNELLSFVKLLVFAGDVFDRLLSLNEDCVRDIDLFIVDVLRECTKHQVVLRVLEGTPSHDARQNCRFTILKEALGIELDYEYHDTVQIEYIASLGIHVLYIPDDAHADTEQTQRVVQELLKSRSLKQVDLSVMHGYFQYQLPYDTKPGSYHDIEYYSQITKYWITIGHVHTRSMNGKVLAQGSFDRITHGEEEDKGFVLASINEHPQAWFIDNPHAHVYKTINITDQETSQALKNIDQALQHLPDGSRIRLQMNKDHPLNEGIKELMLQYPKMHWSKLIKSKEEPTVAEKILDDRLSTYQSLKIDQSNIHSLVQERLKSKLPQEMTEKVIERLKEVT